MRPLRRFCCALLLLQCSRGGTSFMLPSTRGINCRPLSYFSSGCGTTAQTPTKRKERNKFAAATSNARVFLNAVPIKDGGDDDGDDVEALSLKATKIQQNNEASMLPNGETTTIVSVSVQEPVNGDNDNNSSTLNAADAMKNLRSKVLETRQRAAKAERTIEELQCKLSSTQTALIGKERELKEKLASWAREKDTLASRIDELDDLLETREKEAKSREKEFFLVKSEEKRILEDEIEKTTKTLRETQIALDLEQEKASMLRTRLEEAQDQYEFEQMRFEKDKAKLSESMKEQKVKLTEVENRLLETQKNFESERQALEQQILRESSKLAESRSQLRSERSDYRSKERSLRRTIDKQETMLKNIDKQLQTEQAQFVEEKAILEEMLEKSNAQLNESEGLLNTRWEQYNETTDDLEMRIVLEIAKVNQLKDKLQAEQDRFSEEKEALNEAVSEERLKFEEMETKMKEQQRFFSVERQKLQDEIAQGERVRAAKAKQMKRRYDKVRWEMTELWQQEKRKGRQELVKLDAVYKARIAKLRETIRRLQKEVEEANEVKAQLEDVMFEKGLLLDEKKERDRLLDELRKAEKAYTKALADRDESIDGLQRDLDFLKSGVKKRDDQLISIQSSYRELFSLAVSLFRQRASRRRKKWEIRRPRRKFI